MTYRSIIISNPARLQINRSQLQIIVGDNNHNVALEDVACIILNHYQIMLSGAVLASCAKNNVVLISCDEKHLPNGMFHSYLPHSRQNLVIQKQLGLTLPFKKRLWQIIIEQKILNQALVIERLGLSLMISNQLYHLAGTVLSGDKQNNEAQASKLYFPTIFGIDFIRISKNKPVDESSVEYKDINAMLNYTYTIIRSLICRSLVGFGLLPTLGIFHDNQLNAFNLADDFIEPYRPYIDWYIYNLVNEKLEIGLSPVNKANLVDILNYIIMIDDKLTTVLNSIEVTIKSYISCINEDNYNLIKLPHIPPLVERSNMD